NLEAGIDVSDVKVIDVQADFRPHNVGRILPRQRSQSDVGVQQQGVYFAVWRKIAVHVQQGHRSAGLNVANDPRSGDHGTVNTRRHARSLARRTQEQLAAAQVGGNAPHAVLE